jgi:hypothetical protein
VVCAEDDSGYGMVGTHLSVMASGAYQFDVSTLYGFLDGQSISASIGHANDFEIDAPMRMYQFVVEGSPGQFITPGFSLDYQTDHTDTYIEQLNAHAMVAWRNLFADVSTSIQAVRLYTEVVDPARVEFFGTTRGLTLGYQSQGGSSVSLGGYDYNYSADLTQFANLDVMSQLSDSVLANAWGFEKYRLQLSGFYATRWGGLGLDVSASESAVDHSKSFQLVPSATIYLNLYWELNLHTGFFKYQNETATWFAGAGLSYWY